MVQVEHCQIWTSSGYMFDAFRGDLAQVDGKQESERNIASEVHAQDECARRCLGYASLSTKQS